MQNDLLNTEWQIITAHKVMTLMGWQGGVTLPALTVSGFLPSANLVTFYCSDTNQLRVGDLFIGHETNGSQATDIMGLCSIRVTEIVPNSYFKGYLPRGALSPASRPLIARPIQRGDWIGETGNAADYWNKAAADYFCVDYHAENLDIGTKRVACIVRKTTGASFHQQTLEKDVALDYAGQPYTAKFRVKSNGSWRVYINDNGAVTYGATQSGSGYIESQVSISAVSGVGNLTIGVEHLGAVGTCYFYSKPFATNEASIPDNYYRQSERELIPVVKYTPDTLNGATLTMPTAGDGFGTFGWTVRFYEETNGAVSDDVNSVNLCWEFTCPNANKTLAWRNQQAVPHIYGEIATNSYSGSKVTGNGKIWLKNGCAFLYTDTAGQAFNLVSADLSSFGT